MKEIIRYAAERQVEIIPEIDVPAHSNAALASYPEFACPVVKDFIGVLPGLGAKNAEIIFCAGNEGTFDFLQNVLDEVMALFPSRYINLGGDEARKTNWKNVLSASHAYIKSIWKMKKNYKAILWQDCPTTYAVKGRRSWDGMN